MRTYHTDHSASKTKASGAKSLPKYAKEHLSAIRDYMASKVEINASEKGKGKIVIPFHSKEEFQRIKKILSGE